MFTVTEKMMPMTIGMSIYIIHASLSAAELEFVSQFVQINHSPYYPTQYSEAFLKFAFTIVISFHTVFR